MNTGENAMSQTPDEEIIVRASSGNLFADLGRPDAEEALAREENRIIRLSVEDQGRFVDLLLNPPPPAPALVRAKEAHAALFGS